ncbi:hypothetical protein OIU91_04155 [Streptomyces sp. NBC_01456]|uniref:hypothetical protein n=1 Tax=unclassified Streptomyces TaxID=2593676 RepID=UPI002E352EC5|nr:MULTISPECIES: hypothetical protein [unclassified Streptomyces]
MIREDVLSLTPADISTWRKQGGQEFFAESRLLCLSIMEGIQLTSRIGVIPASQVPTRIEEMRDFLATQLPTTSVALETQCGRRPGGIVLRTHDRGHIAKARLEDYEKALRRRSGR